MSLPRFVNTMTTEEPSLIRALDTQDVQMAIYYIDRHVGLSERDQHGNTPLHLSTLYGFRRIAMKLMNLGVDIFAVNDDLETPLHIATRRGDYGMVKYLLYCGGYNDFTNAWGDSPAAIALSYHHHTILAHIMKHVEKDYAER